MRASEFTDLLNAVRPNGSGWKARCPGHDDREASLSIHEGDDDRILLRCFAGCETPDVVAAMGLTMVDLFPERPEPTNGHRPQQLRRIVETYPYYDEHGELLYEALRYEPKGFSQRRPDGSGGWLYNLQGVRRVLYRLPELLAVSPARWVLIVEGEKDANRLAPLGFVATTCPQGAGKWRDEYSETLRGRHVAIIPDNDGPGRKHAEQVARSLQGIAAEIKVVDLPGLPDKGDVSDWLDAGGTKLELQRIVRDAPVWTPDAEPAPGPVPDELDWPDEPGALARTGRRVMVSAKILCAADVMPEPVRWLWPGRIPLGKLTVIDGDPGLGKSTMMADIAARVTTHGLMPDGSRSALEGPAGVLVLSAEDGAGDTIRPRLEAAGADLERVQIWDANLDDDGSEMLPSLPEDIGLLAGLIQEHGVAMVTIDPIMAYLGAKTNSYRDQDVRRALAPLAKIGEATGAAIVLVRHLNKAMGGSAIYRGGGSIGIVGAARSGLLVGRDPEHEERCILASTKSNLGPAPPSLAYRLEGHVNGAGYVVWEGVTTHTADALVSQPQGDEERTARDDAVDFLRDVLVAGPMPAKDVQRQAREAGISEMTLRRAKGPANVTWRREGFGKDGTVLWEIPTAIDVHANSIDAIDVHQNGRSSMGTDEHLWGNRDTWQPSEHPDKCRECTMTLRPEELSAGICEWCRERGKDHAEGKEAS